MSTYRKFSEVEAEYFRDHPEEIDGYISLIFVEYAKDGDPGALLSSLRVLSRVKGIGKIASEAGLSRKSVQKALSENGNPELARIKAIIHSMGYRLAPKKIGTGNWAGENYHSTKGNTWPTN